MGFRVLLTEHQSPLGAAVLKGFEAHSLPVVTAEALDGRSLNQLCEQLHPSVIVHPLLATAGQGLESARQLSRYSQATGCPLLYLSSHEVFGIGQQGNGLTESDPPIPDTAAGQIFYEAEQLLASCEHRVVIRLPWITDMPDGPLERLCQTLIYTRECVVCDSWRGSPVLIEDVVRLLLAMVRQILYGAQNWGYFHLHASDYCSEAELADHVSRILQKAGYETSPIFIGPLEQRFMASNGWLKGQRCTNNFGFQFRSWRQGIKSRVFEWLERETAAGRLAPAAVETRNPGSLALPYE